jgi:hypothetical protein
MVYERVGYRHGAWVIRIGEQTLTIEAGGTRSFFGELVAHPTTPAC